LIALRPVEAADLPILFEHQRDQVSVELADVQPRDREAFDARWADILADPEVLVRAITLDDEVVGHTVSFPLEGVRMVGYWLDRGHWGRGIVSDAFAQFLRIETRRPVYARTARHNAGSIRVLQKAGFLHHRDLPDGLEFVLA
jgi:RimJ/RimL family protein N-acetyltransferase